MDLPLSLSLSLLQGDQRNDNFYHQKLTMQNNNTSKPVYNYKKYIHHIPANLGISGQGVLRFKT